MTLRAWMLILLWAVPAFGQQPLPSELGEAICRVRCGGAAGTGTLIGKDGGRGLVVSCFHVVRGESGPVQCHFPSNELLAGNIIAADTVNDLIAIEIAAPRCAPVALPDYKPEKGQAMWSAGFGGDSVLAVNAGVLVKYTDRGDGSWLGFKLTGDARPGDSGGPIFNERGELAGVLWGAGDGEVAGTGNMLINTLLMQCPSGSCPPRRPLYRGSPVAVQPRPAQPSRPPSQPPAAPPAVVEKPKPAVPAPKGCECDGQGKCECDLSKPGCKCDENKVSLLEARITQLELNLARYESREWATPEDVAAAIKAIPPITAFNIDPKTGKPVGQGIVVPPGGKLGMIHKRTK